MHLKYRSRLGVRLLIGACGLLVLAVFLPGCGGSRADADDSSAAGGSAAEPIDLPVSAEGDPVTIVAMGDSLTEGVDVGDDETYPAQLERRLREDGYAVDVINSGNSGETSSGALSRLDWVLTLEPDILILATGGNDGLRGTDPTLTAENIDGMVTTLLEEEIIVILAGMQMVQNMGEAYNAEFQAIYPAIAEEHPVILVPFLLEGVAANPDLNQPDFVHPNADGNAVIVDTLYPYVLDALVQLETSN